MGSQGVGASARVTACPLQEQAAQAARTSLPYPERHTPQVPPGAAQMARCSERQLSAQQRPPGCSDRPTAQDRHDVAL
jgi:hypothetical protein